MTFHKMANIKKDIRQLQLNIKEAIKARMV